MVSKYFMLRVPANVFLLQGSVNSLRREPHFVGKNGNAGLFFNEKLFEYGVGVI